MAAPFISEPGAAQQAASQAAQVAASAMEHGPHNPARPQPVEKLHIALMRGRHGQPVEQPIDAHGEGSANARHGLTKQRPRGAAGAGTVTKAGAPPVQPFGPSMPFLAHLIAHEMGTFKASYMPAEQQGLFGYTATDAYQAVIERERMITIGAPPAQSAN